jgi:hypothetical protein
LILAACFGSAPAAEAVTFSDEAAFLAAVTNPTTVSFNLFSVGFVPQSTLQLGDVTVTSTAAGSSPIFGPGSFGFTTNFLSEGVQDGGNNIVITFPAGTQAAGMKLASVFPVTVTATYLDTGTETVSFSASQVAFLGFGDTSGLQSIRISSLFTPAQTPIVNVGDITYAPALTAPATVEVPTLSQAGLLLLSLGLTAAAWRMLKARTAG